MADDNVIDLQARLPHTAGKVRCLDCKYEWVGVAPVGTHWMECLACHMHKATWVYPTLPDEAWECKCGNDLFYLMPDGDLRCPKCSERHDPQRLIR